MPAPCNGPRQRNGMFTELHSNERALRSPPRQSAKDVAARAVSLSVFPALRLVPLGPADPNGRSSHGPADPVSWRTAKTGPRGQLSFAEVLRAQWAAAGTQRARCSAMLRAQLPSVGAGSCHRPRGGQAPLSAVQARGRQSKVLRRVAIAAAAGSGPAAQPPASGEQEVQQPSVVDISVVQAMEARMLPRHGSVPERSRPSSVAAFVCLWDSQTRTARLARKRASTARHTHVSLVLIVSWAGFGDSGAAAAWAWIGKRVLVGPTLPFTQHLECESGCGSPVGRSVTQIQRLGGVAALVLIRRLFSTTGAPRPERGSHHAQGA